MQIGTIISCGSPAGMLDWVVDFTYKLDTGGMGLSRVIVANNPNAPYLTGTITAKMWTSSTSTITVSPKSTWNDQSGVAPMSAVGAKRGIRVGFKVERYRVTPSIYVSGLSRRRFE